MSLYLHLCHFPQSSFECIASVNNNFPNQPKRFSGLLPPIPLKLNAIVLFQFKIGEKPPKFCFTETQVILNTLSSGIEKVKARKT